MIIASAPIAPHVRAHGTQTADLVAQVSPAVVNIFTTQERRRGPDLGELPFPPGHPLREFFERFAGPGGPGANRNREPRESLGSGFIFDPAGFVITNHHVVEDADSIKIMMGDEREFDATVVGSDELTDIALLKIETGQPLPFVTFGNSDSIRVGEDVVAVGNAFGLGGTVTRGIVSAKGRDIRLSGPYVDYIQTDAAINRGNSGGPLFNTNGQVIGVNTAIFSPTGGSVGVGFAVADISRDGDVDRGRLGISIQSVDEALAQALNLGSPRGALVTSVQPDGPSVGTLISGDVILDFNGVPIIKSRDLPRVVARADR